MRNYRIKTLHLFSIFSGLILLLLPGLFSGSALAQKTGNVKGKVVSIKGDMIVDVSVVARKNGKDIKTTVTDLKGAFVLNDLEVGDYNIVLEKYGYALAIIYNVKVQKSNTRNLGNKLILRVDKGTQVIIKGSVFDQNGRSIPNVKIEIEYIKTNESPQYLGRDYSSESGEFGFQFPEKAGIFIVKASAQNVSISKEINVNSPGIYRLALTLVINQSGRRSN